MSRSPEDEAAGHKIYLKNTSGVDEDFKLRLFHDGGTFGTGNVSSISDNLYIGYIDIYIPYYDPNTSDGYNNTVAGYEMSVFDNLNYCQKRMWAMKNDIHWTGITDNPTLTKCSEDDFFSPVNFNVSFSLTATINQDCLYDDVSDGYFDRDGNQCNDPSNTLVTDVTPVQDTFSWAEITDF